MKSAAYYRSRAAFCYRISWIAVVAAIVILAIVLSNGLFDIQIIAASLFFPGMVVLWGRVEARLYLQSATDAQNPQVLA